MIAMSMERAIVHAKYSEFGGEFPNQSEKRLKEQRKVRSRYDEHQECRTMLQTGKIQDAVLIHKSIRHIQSYYLDGV